MHPVNAGDVLLLRGPATASPHVPEKAVAAARAEADIVVVAFHMGLIGRPVVLQYQTELAMRAVDAGADVITMGNHTFGKQDILKLFDTEKNIIRPANYPDSVPGCGSVIISAKGVKIGIINIMGRVNIDIPLDCPFKACDKEIEKIKDKCDIIMVDFHAEATSEKRAMLFYLDGRVSAIFGTHTHVQTADEEVTGRGTGYITDLGMTGCIDSVLGVDKNIIVNRFTTGMPRRFDYSYGRAALCGAVFAIDEKSGRCTGIKRIRVL